MHIGRLKITINTVLLLMKPPAEGCLFQIFRLCKATAYCLLFCNRMFYSLSFQYSSCLRNIDEKDAIKCTNRL